MPDGSAALTLTLHAKIAEIDAADWDACAGDGNPFVSHAFLSAMEDSGSANARTGWLPQHGVLRGEGRSHRRHCTDVCEIAQLRRICVRPCLG